MATEKKPQLTKEALDARFTALQDKNRERRQTKVTAADIENRLTESRAKRAAKVVPGQRARVVSLGLGIALFVGSGALAVNASSSTDAFEQTSMVNEQLIASMQGNIRSIPAGNDDPAGEYAANLEGQITAALAKGEELASIQQEFAPILYAGNGESSGNGAPSAAVLAAVEHRRLVAPYFVERALFVEDGLAYAPGSMLPFETDEIDPRFPWYVSYEPGSRGRIVANPEGSRWELVSMVATDTPGVLDATWLNQSAATGDLHAWATASYYVDPGAFGNLTVGTTTIGERGSSMTGTDGE